MLDVLTIENELIVRLNQIEDRIGNTPLLDISDISPNPNVKIYAKAEWNQLGGSVKARAAYRIIRHALEDGRLNAEKELLDASSGNTAIAYATIAKEIGLRTTLVIPENAGAERKNILIKLGANLVFSSPFEGTDGAQQLAKQIFMAMPSKYFYADQYNNQDNWEAHFYGTAPEIIQQSKGAITHFVAALGTTGTFTGVGRFLKKYYPKVKLIQLQPNNPMHGLEGWKHLETAKVPGIFDDELADENLEIDSEEALKMIKRIYELFNIKVSPSAAAAVVGTIETANKIQHGVIVTTLADNGDKYAEVYESLKTRT
ncbi:PLP-dependent cysteine synthase family protein [Crocinitomix catalasitica]|nr:PLP-dependent cysteine synthase family protein [Crocinitomix catalasitica]